METTTNNAEQEKRPAQGQVALVIGPDSEVAATVHDVLPAWQIVRAENNAAGLAMLKERPYDLVLTGEGTSGKEDVELLRQIRIVRPHTRLIILTNESTPGDVLAAMRERAFSYFSRPYAMDTFREMILLATTGPVWDEGIEILAATTQWIRLLARCDLRTADRLLQFIHEISDLPVEERAMVGQAFRELLMNAIEHGAHFDSAQHVEISYVRAKHLVACRVKDPGRASRLRNSAMQRSPTRRATRPAIWLCGKSRDSGLAALESF